MRRLVELYFAKLGRKKYFLQAVFGVIGLEITVISVSFEECVFVFLESQETSGGKQNKLRLTRYFL